MKRQRAPSGKTPVKKVKLSPAGKQAVKKIVVPRVSTRLAKKHNVKTKLVLVVTSSYIGVDTQKENTAQAIYFDQKATLQLATDPPHALKHYYEFTQEVRDSYTLESGETQALTAWAWDDPYGPDYSDAQIEDLKTSIAFKDEPGFSTNTRIAVGKWLTHYDVHFRWKVKDIASNTTWTSPEIHHYIRSPYNAGADGPVNDTAAGDFTWTLATLPDRI